MASVKAQRDIICGLKSCTNADDLNKQGRVEVKAFTPPKHGGLAINWTDDGQATFHRNCWTSIRRGSESDKLHDVEKDMVKEASKTAEYFDSQERIDIEARRIAEYLKTCCHAIAFTGAGISTSAGIGDFRGKAGKWTERDKKKQYGKAVKAASDKGSKRNYEALRPTYTHEAIAKLIEMGLLKYVISQNVDGLHRLSGISAEQISELHGNAFHEKCEKCGKRFERSYAPRAVHKQTSTSTVPPKKCSSCRINHRTGGVCDKKACKGYLMNTIINFGDSLERDVISNAEKNACANDLVLCLGSSLTVSPACDFVEMGSSVRIVICNRQPTPFDDASESDGSRVYCDCDDLMRRVMKHILDAADLTEWEEARSERMQNYSSLRTVADSTK